MKHSFSSRFPYLILVFTLLLTGSAFVQPQSVHAKNIAPTSFKQATEPINIPMGVYVATIYGIDYEDESYKVVFWAWWNHTPSDLKEVGIEHDYQPHEEVEIINARNYDIDQSYSITYDNGDIYTIAKFDAVINQSWDIIHFPFDRQDLTIIIESVGHLSSAIHFSPDPQNSIVNQNIVLDGWQIEDLTLIPEDYQYDTNFGYRGADKESFSRMTINIPVQRQGIRIFINSYIGFFIAFLISSLLYVIDLDLLSSRLRMTMSALFATVGNKYTIDRNFPTRTTFSLSDNIEIATFGAVALSLIVTIVCMLLIDRGKRDLAEKINRFTFPLSIAIYVFMVSYGVYLALTT